jgi:hypothetical protein
MCTIHAPRTRMTSETMIISIHLPDNILGRLRSDARRDPSPLSSVRDYQPGHYPLRQIHGSSQRVSLHYEIPSSALRRPQTLSRITTWANQDRYAYVEFADPSIVENALVLNESSFRSRLITVSQTFAQFMVCYVFRRSPLSGMTD